MQDVLSGSLGGHPLSHYRRRRGVLNMGLYSIVQEIKSNQAIATTLRSLQFMWCPFAEAQLGCLLLKNTDARPVTERRII